MKKIINYLGIPVLVLMAALVFLPVSCNKEAVKDNPEADNSSQLIKISGEDVSVATKTTLAGLVTSWNATAPADQVGIYCGQAKLNNVVGVANTPYTAVTSAAISTFTGDMKWGTGTHYFYAYYPYLAGSAVATVVPITLVAAQTQTSSSSHIGTYDFMVATPLTADSPGAGTSTTVNFHYNHVFTILEFNILSDNAEVITEVKLTAPSGRTIAFSGGTIDITQPTPLAGAPYAIAGIPSSSSNEITLTITPGVKLTNSTSTTPSIYMMILPGDLSADNISISIKANGTDRVLTKTGKNFLRGKKYKSVMTTDIDGNVYSTVTIGTQTWMAENLKTTKYNDGSAIPNVTTAGITADTWGGLITGAYCWYDNNAVTNKATYGALYNWYAVNTGKLCPTGWHLPTDSEWTTLTTFLGGESVASGKLKETGTSHWISPNTGTNSSGFTALPGGSRTNDGTFNFIGNFGYWWSSTEFSTNNAWTRFMRYDYSFAYRYEYYKTYGCSVRCVKGETVSDIDGNVYNTVTIGTQVWMAENLKTTKYRNGDPIGTTSPATLDISNATTYPTPKYQWAYAGNESNVATYGRLYTCYAATENRNVCPTGWHVPTDTEWTALTTFLGGESVAGGKLKETGFTHWTTSNTGATNETGFTALPGGYRYNNGTFNFVGSRGAWWSSTTEASLIAWVRAMYDSYSGVSRYTDNMAYGLSVRCVRN